MQNGDYGKELIIDLHECDISTFTRKSIRNYLKQLCDEIIFMERADFHWWDYHGMSGKEYRKIPAHLKGISAVQFIMTSTIAIHTLDDLQKVFINIFSCKDFDTDAARYFTQKWFKGQLNHWEVVRRK
uniref:Putative S-adenosylmethionine decarboxylase n=1 Tax=viral metagenome TaxID=1070528 RepID=A0A6H1Z9Q3_9ZZZZ